MEVRSIYLVDDDKIANFVHQKTIKDKYKEIGLRSFTGVSSALAALETTDEELPDLMVLDLNMPIDNGWDMLGELQLRELQIPVIVLSSSFRDDDRRRAFSYENVIGFLSKPLKIQELLELIHIS